MADFLVAGLINLETTLSIEAFPVVYNPVRYPFFGVKTTVSGVGYNIAKALTFLGHHVTFLSLIGQDTAGELTRRELVQIGVDDTHVFSQLAQTPQSVILYDPQGKRAINTDLKDIQEQAYPIAAFEAALNQVDLAVLCNVNFSRPMLEKAHAAGITIATDVHAIRDIHDAYNAEYMRHADILFQSHENLSCSPQDWIRQLWDVYGTPIVVVGIGGEGAMMGIKAESAIYHIPAVYTRPVISTIGAGDALFSAFLHTYAHTQDPHLAIRKAVVFASYKIGVAGAADGFLDATALDEWHRRLNVG